MEQDPRRVVGGQVHALAKHVTAEAECRRLFGSNWNQKLVDGEVVDVSCEEIKLLYPGQVYHSRKDQDKKVEHQKC